MTPITRRFAGIAAGLALTGATVLAGPGAASAATLAGHAVPTVVVQPLVTNMLGQTTTQAKHWQCFLRNEGFSPGTIDGSLGTDSWKAAQRFFNWDQDYVDGPLTIDGTAGPETIKALQSFLKYTGGYSVTIDGIAGPDTEYVFSEFNTPDDC